MYVSYQHIVSQYCSGDLIEKTGMGRACRTYGGEEKCTQGFGGESWVKETTWKTQAPMGW